MKNRVYLGDIDPNNSILPVMDIRRIIMFQLLIWDSIVLSDSQLLTDPRLNILMGNYNGDEIQKKYGVSDVDNSCKGIESLFENGLIEIAIRQNANSESSLSDTWHAMRTSTNKVPYLPEDEEYVRYLSSVKCNTHKFETSNMSSMFQQNLSCGINTDPEKGGFLLQKNDVEKQLRVMFEGNAPLFRDILDYLRQHLQSGDLDPIRYAKLYDYVYSCYNINISRALGCNINTKFSNIPIHIQTGEEYQGKSASQEQISRLRPTWALNPIFLDCMTFEEFVEVRKNLKAHKVREFYLNSIMSPWSEIEDEWNNYVETLELRIKNIMLEKQNRLHRQIFSEFGNDKYLTKPKQITVATPIFEIVKSIVSFVPVIGDIIGFADVAKSIVDGVVAYSRHGEREKIIQEYVKISEIVSNGTRVVTRYN
ncbi:MAG: hypothetical protein E7665_10810 [Ruminococcaceae bacterium]|nr:hypothetical protein [Oscillospiraceae bacterium]